MVKEFGYEYDAVRDRELWERTAGKKAVDPFWGANCYRSGRDALKEIARRYRPTDVLLPALSCDCMFSPFTMYGHKVHFYKLTKTYSADLAALKAMLPARGGILLYMNYFGLPAFSEEDLRELHREFPTLVLVEDITHNLFSWQEGPVKPDYVVASLRKWIAVPDGGLLWSDRPMSSLEYDVDFSFSETRLTAQCMRNEYFHTGNENLKTAYRKIFTEVSDILDAGKLPACMSLYSQELMKRADWNRIRETRKANSEYLSSILRDAGISLIQQEAGISDLYVPFLLEHRDETQRKLSPIGVFNTIIWPLTQEQKSSCPVARFTQEHMLAAPCDQRYTLEDMKLVGESIVRAVHE